MRHQLRLFCAAHVCDTAQFVLENLDRRTDLGRQSVGLVDEVTVLAHQLQNFGEPVGPSDMQLTGRIRICIDRQALSPQVV